MNINAVRCTESFFLNFDLNPWIILNLWFKIISQEKSQHLHLTYQWNILMTLLFVSKFIAETLQIVFLDFPGQCCIGSKKRSYFNKKSVMYFFFCFYPEWNSRAHTCQAGSVPLSHIYICGPFLSISMSFRSSVCNLCNVLKNVTLWTEINFYNFKYVWGQLYYY